MTESQGYRNLLMDHRSMTESSRLGIRLPSTDQGVNQKKNLQDSNTFSLLDNTKADSALTSSWIQRLKPHSMSSDEISKGENYVWTHFSKDFSSSHRRKDKALNHAREDQPETKVTNAKEEVHKSKPNRILRVPSDEGTHSSDASWRTGNMSRQQNDGGMHASMEALVPSFHNNEASSTRKHKDMHETCYTPSLQDSPWLKENEKASSVPGYNGLCCMQASSSSDNGCTTQSPAQTVSDVDTKHVIVQRNGPEYLDQLRLTESGTSMAYPSQASNEGVRLNRTYSITMNNASPVKIVHDDDVSMFVENADEKIANKDEVKATNRESRSDLPPKAVPNFGFLLLGGRSKSCMKQPSKPDTSTSMHKTSERLSHNVPQSVIIKDDGRKEASNGVPFKDAHDWMQVKTDGKHSATVVSKSNVPRSCIQPEPIDGWVGTQKRTQHERIIHTGKWEPNRLIRNSTQECNLEEHHKKQDQHSTEVKDMGESFTGNKISHNLSMKACLLPLEKRTLALQNFARPEEKVILPGTSPRASLQDETSKQMELEKCLISNNDDGITKNVWIQRWRSSRSMCLNLQTNTSGFPHGVEYNERKRNTILSNIDHQRAEASFAPKQAESTNYIPFPAYRTRAFLRGKCTSPSAEALAMVGTMASKVQTTLWNGESFIRGSQDTHNLHNDFTRAKPVADKRLEAWMCIDELEYLEPHTE